MDAIAGGLLHLLRHLGSVDQQFLGDAAPDHAGATDAIAFHDGHTCTVSGCPLGSRQATGTGSDHHKIKRLVHRN